MATEPASVSPWSDDSRAKADITGRSEFASAVASRIDRSVDGQSSTVFGVVGPWGSGKTTLLRDIASQLDSWKIVWFSPWSVADTGSLTSEFVSALSEAFPQSSTVKKNLALYSRFGSPVLKLIPVVGDAVSSIATEAITELTKRPAWHSEFRKLSAEIAAQHTRVLVIVDDVDRLDGDELRSLLRLVRLLGRFENVHYLMAYDQATIDRALGTAGESSDFMEKIVQYPFEVPPPPMVVRRRWSRAVLDAVSPSDSGTSGVERAEHREQLVRILASGLETPRAAERLREQMVSLAGLIADAEVDVFDFIALTWLRIAHHEVWNHIRLHPDDYLSWREDDSEATHDDRMKVVEALVRSGHALPVQDAVRYIFEPMGLAGALDGRRGRMQRARYFDRYFQVGLADDDISERRTESALRDLARDVSTGPNVAELKNILVGLDEERSALALDVVRTSRNNSSETSLALLDYVEGVRGQLKSALGLHAVRISSADRWLADELFLALQTKLVSTADLVARFGYQLVATSAYAAKRSHRGDESGIKELYRDFARRWVAEVREEPLRSTLDRPELIQMTSFCAWIATAEDHGGFLSDRVSGGEALIAAATKYVFYNEWVGSGVNYEVVFREHDFRFAVGRSLTVAALAEVSTPAGDPDYDVADRASPDLSDAQCRDFAIRSLRALSVR
ncbi:P-loop NTPase fold protein [Homoserinimonas sp. A520]